MHQANFNRSVFLGFFAKAGIDGLRRSNEKRALGLYTLYYSVLIVRGIGFRVLYSKSEFGVNYSQVSGLWKNQKIVPESWDGCSLRLRKKSGIDLLLAQPLTKLGQLLQIGAGYSKILMLCMGHAYDAAIYKLNGVALRQFKKNRKLVFYGISGEGLKAWTHAIFNYRQPSIYTGRGIRKKKKRARRKLGKKDARKGRLF